jgi:hypothetical protein
MNSILGHLSPPRSPREWRVHVKLPDGVRLDDHATHDRLAAEAAPAGWYCVGTMPISPRERERLDDPAAWSLRVTYWPEAWRERTTLLAPPAVYAAAQIAGLPTKLDSTLFADHDGIQFRTPDGRPFYRQTFWSGRDALPECVLRALTEIAYVDRRRTVGYMWARPNSGRAALVADAEAEGDDARRARACELVRAWIRTNHQEVLKHSAEMQS